MLLSPTNQMVMCDKVAEEMMLLFAESGYPVFRGTSLLSRGLLKNKRRYTPLRIIVSVNQLSICGAIADWCQELAQRVEARCPYGTATLVAKVNSDQHHKFRRRMDRV